MPLFKPLSPHEVTLFKALFFTLKPPCALLKNLLDKHVIVSTANVVLVSAKSLVSLDNLIGDSICLIDASVQGCKHLLTDCGEEIFLFDQSLQLLLKLFGYLELEVSRAPIKYFLLNWIKLLKAFE